MNTENISNLAAIISRAGFENLNYRLVQHVCCKPVHFVLTEKIVRSADNLSCQLYFERHNNDYKLSHYDATLIREQTMPVLSINQVAIHELEKRMKSIDWQLPESGIVFRLNDEQTWEREKTIEAIINDLGRLGATVEGKAYADILKVRFWSGTLIEEITGSLAPVRAKLEISQRFYVLDGECITIDEALRFLQNRWVEKKVQGQRKANMNQDTEHDGASGSAGSGLLKKKRKARARVKHD